MEANKQNSIKEKILEHLDVEDFYSETFEGWEPGSNVKCPFAGKRHEKGEDRNPSMSVSKETGAVFCHACGYKATSPVGLYADLNSGISFKESCVALYHKYVTPLVPEDYVKEAAKKLAANAYVLGKLKELRGIDAKLVAKTQLGYAGGRLVIPIRDEHGMLVNARRYQLLGDGDGPKMVSYAKGFGAARLWPLPALQGQLVVFCEGEMDALVGMQHGLNTITVTGGARTWREEWAQAFKGRDVVLVPDNDKAGADGAAIKSRALTKTARSIVVLRLPGNGTKDLSDWFVKERGTRERFMAMLETGEIGVLPATAKEATNGGAPQEDLLAGTMSDAEKKMVERAQLVLGHMEAGGQFFRNAEGEFYYARPGHGAIRLGTASPHFGAFLSGLSPLLNQATSVGKFVSQHVVNRASIMSATTNSGAWSLYKDGKVFLYEEADSIVKMGDGDGPTKMKNAINADKVLLEPPTPKSSFRYNRDAGAGKAVELLWDKFAMNLAVSDENRYMVVCWLLGALFKEYVRPRPIVRLLAKTAWGKSTASKLVSLLVYNEELLNHSASTTAAAYAMSRRCPVLIFDNIETRNMVPAFEDFLLIAATGGVKTKRAIATDSGTVTEDPNSLVLTNGIEPFNKHELIDRTLEVPMDMLKHGRKGFHEVRVLQGLAASRSDILSGVAKLVHKYVLPRVREGAVQEIARQFGPHAKNRFNEYFGLMSVLLDSVWGFRPLETYTRPHDLVAYWLDSQSAAAKAQNVGTNDVVYFLNTLMDRRKAILDARTEVSTLDNGSEELKTTTRDLLSDFRLLARHLGMQCPWTNERQLGTRLLDAEEVLKTSGWNRRSTVLNGKRFYYYNRRAGAREKKPIKV